MAVRTTLTCCWDRTQCMWGCPATCPLPAHGSFKAHSLRSCWLVSRGVGSCRTLGRQCGTSSAEPAQPVWEQRQSWSRAAVTHRIARIAALLHAADHKHLALRQGAWGGILQGQNVGGERVTRLQSAGWLRQGAVGLVVGSQSGSPPRHAVRDSQQAAKQARQAITGGWWFVQASRHMRSPSGWRAGCHTCAHPCCG